MKYKHTEQITKPSEDTEDRALLVREPVPPGMASIFLSRDRDATAADVIEALRQYPDAAREVREGMGWCVVAQAPFETWVPGPAYRALEIDNEAQRVRIGDLETQLTAVVAQRDEARMLLQAAQRDPEDKRARIAELEGTLYRVRYERAAMETERDAALAELVERRRQVEAYAESALRTLRAREKEQEELGELRRAARYPKPYTGPAVNDFARQVLEEARPGTTEGAKFDDTRKCALGVVKHLRKERDRLLREAKHSAVFVQLPILRMHSIGQSELVLGFGLGQLTSDLHADLCTFFASVYEDCKPIRLVVEVGKP